MRAPDRRPHVEGGQAAEAEPPQDIAHRRQRQSQRVSDLRSTRVLLSQPHEAEFKRGCELARRAPGTRGAVALARPALSPIAPPLLPHGLHTHAEGRSDLRQRPSILDDARHQTHASCKSQPRIGVTVHSAVWQSLVQNPRNPSL